MTSAEARPTAPRVDLGSCNGGTSQSWTVGFGSGGNIKTGGGAHCLTVQGNGTTAGTLVELDGCAAADAAGQKWVAGPNGSLVNPNSGMCLDDPNGVKTVGTQLDIAVCSGAARQDWASEQITYTPDQHVATITTPNGIGTQTDSYAYDADGNLVAQNDFDSDTIYLFGGAEQITYVPANRTMLAQRFYTAPDGTSAVRTVSTTVNPNGIVTNTSNVVTYDVANTQGTPVESWTTGGAVAYRYYDPYGHQIGTPQPWPDNHDFLNKPQDPDTGYDLLGARQYNPATGAFLSLDPLFQPGDPLAMGGYAYAGDNPVNAEDPSGQCPCLTDGGTEQKNPNTGTYGGGGGGVTYSDPGTNSGGQGCDEQCQLATRFATQAANDAERARAAIRLLEANLTTYFQDWSSANNGIFQLLACSPICFVGTKEYDRLNREMVREADQASDYTALSDSSIKSMAVFLGMPRPNLGPEHDVYDPASGGARRITDIDNIFRGALTEEKSATWAQDPSDWTAKLMRQMDKYVEARQYVAGWEDAPVGVRFTNPGVEPELREAVSNAAQQWADDNAIDIVLTFEGE